MSRPGIVLYDPEHHFGESFISEMESEHIVVVFDKHLNYRLVNNAACAQLGMNASELIGRCILDLYPSVNASKNHRNLMRALNGEILSDIIETRKGVYFNTTYHPIVIDGKVAYIIVKARKVKL